MKIEKFTPKTTEVGKSKNGYVPTPSPVMSSIETRGLVPSPAPRPAPATQVPAQSTKK
jgi:hypothetical protein